MGSNIEDIKSNVRELKHDTPERKAYIAELLGTFLLVFVGVGTAVLSGGAVGILGVAAAFGLTLLVLVYAIGPISGCHINPAVTLGVLASGRITLPKAVGYWVAQFVGGIIAALVIYMIAQGLPNGYSAAANGIGANGYGDHSPMQYSAGSALFVELIATFLLVLTVLAATDVKAPAGFAGVAIGMALFLGNLLAIPVTNASINPARSFGPALFAGGWAIAQLWLFVLVPLLGGLCAAGVYRAIRVSAPLVTPRQGETALPSEQVERTRTIPPTGLFEPGTLNPDERKRPAA